MFAYFFVGFAVWFSGVALLLGDATSGVWGNLIEKAMVVVAGLIASAIVLGVRALTKKWGYELKEQQEYELRKFVKESIIWAAEKSSVTEKATGAAHSGGAKLKDAVTRLLDKAPGVTHDEAVKLVEENLAPLGEGAAVSLGKFTDAALN